MNPHRHYSRDTDAEGQFNPHCPWFARVAHTLSAVPACSRVLDVACNSGGMGRQLLSYRPVSLFGLDLAAQWLPYAKAKGYRVVQSAAEAIPFADRSFDVVICSELLEHADNPSAVIREVHRVLRPGGLFLGDVPTWYGRWGYRSIRGHKWHRRVFTKGALRELVGQVGTIRSLRAYPSWGRSSPFWVPQWYGWEVER